MEHSFQGQRVRVALPSRTAGEELARAAQRVAALEAQVERLRGVLHPRHLYLVEGDGGAMAQDTDGDRLAATKKRDRAGENAREVAKLVRRVTLLEVQLTALSKAFARVTGRTANDVLDADLIAPEEVKRG